MYIAIGLLVLLVVFGPQAWVRMVMARHGAEIPGMPGTGGELATHLCDALQLDGVTVTEVAQGGDHYNPNTKTVGLSPANFHGRTLTAVAVATHEIGHAVQHQRAERLMMLRNAWYPRIKLIEKVGVTLLTLAPVMTLITRAPIVTVVMIIAGFAFFGARIAFHALTLPIEWDASFGKALPIIEHGEYVAPEELPAIRQVLRAAALTYTASALADALSVWRWLLLFRGRWF